MNTSTALVSIVIPSHNEGDDVLATVDLGGIRSTVNVSMIEAPAVGEYVVVHAGVAIAKLDEREAEETKQEGSSVHRFYLSVLGPDVHRACGAEDGWPAR